VRANVAVIEPRLVTELRGQGGLKSKPPGQARREGDAVFKADSSGQAGTGIERIVLCLFDTASPEIAQKRFAPDAEIIFA